MTDRQDGEDRESRIRELEGELRSVRESARELEERYRAITGRSLDIIYTHDFQGNFLDANEAIVGMLGYGMEEIRSVSFKDIIVPEMLPRAMDTIAEILKTGYQKKPNEYRIRCRNGSCIWIETKGSLIYRDGRPHAIHGIARDITERKRSEELVRERELRYRAIFENTGNASILFGEDTVITLANTNFALITGYSREEMEGKMSWTSFIAPEDLERMERYHAQRRKAPSSAPSSYEFVMVTRSGARRDVFLSVGVIPETQERIASCMDITERKRVERDLRESRERFRGILDNMEEAYYEVDLAGNFTFFNATAMRALGYTNEEMDGMNFRTFVDAENAKKVFLHYHKVFTTGKPVPGFDWEVICKNDARLPVEASVSLVRDERGNPVGFRGVVRDVTERKKAEGAIRKSEERFRDMARLLPETVFEADERGILTFVNEAAFDKFGYSREDFWSGIRGIDVLAPGDRMRALANFRRIREGEDVGLTEYTATRKDGTEFPVLIHAVGISEEGQAAGIRGFIIDISEKKNLEEQFMRAQKMEAIGKLAGGIAHDFNNLLMGILGNVSLMLMTLESGHPFHERLRNMEEYVRQGSDLTRQFLGFARGGKYDVKPTDLGKLVRRNAEMFGRSKKEVRIHHKLQDDLWTVEVDRGQIDQVLLNIFVNAWQAMPGGGDLYLTVENARLSPSDVAPHGLEAGRYVSVAVADTGVGMDEATMARIFEPFFTTREKSRGTGLGLASVYGIVRNHKGFVTVRSEKGAGSTFVVFLPASDREEETEAKVVEPIQKGGETILLVDDEGFILDVGVQMLTHLGYKVIPASGGREAVETYRSRRPEIDLVLLDMIMPDLGGKETFEKIKEIEPGVRVILSSGYSLDGQAEKIMEKGCRGFIQKPFSMGDLAGKIREVLDAG